jgi:hypothetical protein
MSRQTREAWWTYALTLMSVGGAVLNVLQSRIGFALWICSNTGWIVYAWRRRLWPQLPAWIVFLGLAIWGWFAWT